jgi:hypothetical protein
LEDGLQPSSNRIGGVCLKCFRTVASCEDKGLAATCCSKAIGELIAFAGKDQWGHFAQFGYRFFKGNRIRPWWLLGRD